MAALTGSSSWRVDTLGKKVIIVNTPSSADSADTIDLSDSAATGGEVLSTIHGLYVYDQSSGDSVTCTFSGTVVTLDAAGGTTNHVYSILAWGV